MDKLTLDTNILRDWAWSEDRSVESRYAQDAETKHRELEVLFEKLQTLRDAGVCEIGITSQLYMDYGKEPKELPQHIVDMIGPYVHVVPPDMFGFLLSFPVIFPDKEKVQRIFDDVFPNSRPDHRKYHKNQKDAWQLYAHQATGRDIFVTEDKGILQRQSTLAEKWNIRVKSLHEYILEASRAA